MKKLALFVVMLLAANICSFAVTGGGGGDTLPDILVFDNGDSGAVPGLLDSLGYAYHVWGIDDVLGGTDQFGNPIADTEFEANPSGIRTAGYKMVITGSGGGYDGLKANMAMINPADGSSYHDDWLYPQGGGRVVLSGQTADVSGGSGAQTFTQSMIDWILAPYDGTGDDVGLGFMMLSDNIDQFDWLPWMTEGNGVATNVTGNDVAVSSGAANHDIFANDNQIGVGYLNNWNPSYTSVFTALPTNFVGLTENNAGQYITIVNGDANVVPGNVPEPMSVGLLGFGALLLIRLVRKNS